MNLFGWDTVSAIGLELANKGLASAGAALPSSFDHRTRGMRVNGRFGAWRIVRGGSMRRLHMEIDIAEGTARGLGGGHTRRAIKLDGSTLMIEIPLDLVPSPDGVKPAELRFRYAEDGAQDIVLPLGFDDASGRINAVQADMIQYAICDCLSQNMGGIGHVFARIDPGTNPEHGWAATPHIDWAWLETGDGRSYLAILGSLTPPTAAMAPEKFDPGLLAGKGSAYVALSNRMYVQRLLQPWMQTHFRPKGKFRSSGTTVELAAPVKLGKTKSPVGTLEPVLTRLRLVPNATGLAIQTVSDTKLGIGSLVIELDLQIRARLGKDGAVRMVPDKKPRVRHRIVGAGILSGLVQVVVDLIMAIAGTSVDRIAANVAGAMQGMNVPAALPASWPGVRRFQATEFHTDGGLWFCDSRPVKGVQAPAPRPADAA